MRTRTLPAVVTSKRHCLQIQQPTSCERMNMPQSRRHYIGKLRRYLPDSTLWKNNDPMLGRRAAAVGKVEEDWNPRAQQKCWPGERTFERSAMMKFVTTNVALNERNSFSELSD
jgi:hypothetical protein